VDNHHSDPEVPIIGPDGLAWHSPAAAAPPREELNQMQIRTRMCMSVDGYVTTPDGRPAQVADPAWDPEVFGFREFQANCDAVLMGRTTFEPALGADEWPWADLEVFVVASHRPSGTPDHVVVDSDPRRLLESVRDRNRGGDVHLVGGPRTIETFRLLGALDELGPDRSAAPPRRRHAAHAVGQHRCEAGTQTATRTSDRCCRDRLCLRSYAESDQRRVRDAYGSRSHGELSFPAVLLILTWRGRLGGGLAMLLLDTALPYRLGQAVGYTRPTSGSWRSRP
jgi:dihydrofolate reductase